MANPREYRHGAAPRLAGPDFHTHQIHHWISEHPGATRDEIIAAAIQHELVFRGYAHREYAHRLNFQIEKNKEHRATSPARCSPPTIHTPASIAATRSDAAVRFVVIINLAAMQRYGSIACEEGRYRVLRPLKATSGGVMTSQILSNPVETAKLSIEAELFRALQDEYARPQTPRTILSKRIRTLLRRWFDIKMRERLYLDRTPGTRYEDRHPDTQIDAIGTTGGKATVATRS